MAKTTRRVADEALAFLDRQRLDPTPQNYALAYNFVTGGSSHIVARVNEATDGGVRMTQDQADEIIAMYGLGGMAAEPVSDPNEAVRHQLLRLADITSSQTAATSRFGRDLTDGMSRMEGGPADLLGIVGSMIERTAAAERELAAAAAEAEQLRQDLEAARNDANKDALTGLPNRRSIDALLAKLEKAGKARTLAFCDVDRFKSVNDTYGHAVGDRVLKAVADTLTAECSKHATVARWGGEEFVIVFQAADLQQAAGIVDRARASLCEKKFKLRDTDQPLGAVSFSAGIATGSGATTDITAVADKLLYRAKQEGRNRVLTQ